MTVSNDTEELQKSTSPKVISGSKYNTLDMTLSSNSEIHRKIAIFEGSNLLFFRQMDRSQRIVFDTVSDVFFCEESNATSFRSIAAAV